MEKRKYRKKMPKINYMAIPGVIECRVINNDIRDIRRIVSVVSRYFKITEDRIYEKTRKREIVMPRQIAHYLAKKHTKHSYVLIGYEIGGKDHATVMYSVRTVNDLRDVDYGYRRQLEEIESKLITG